MPRPVSWLPRLHEIARSVTNSVRSHYDRGDLERLYELQPRAAQKLLDLMPSVRIGTSRLVEREELASFLDRVRDAENTTELFERMRLDKAQISRRKVRTLVRRDLDPIGLASLPSTIGRSRGRLEVSFRSIEQLAESLYVLARVLDCDMDAFAREFEPEQAEPEPDDAGEMKELFIERERMESARRLSLGVWPSRRVPSSGIRLRLKARNHTAATVLLFRRNRNSPAQLLGSEQRECPLRRCDALVLAGGRLVRQSAAPGRGAQEPG